MRVVLTGGTGFIGSRLARSLIERGDNVFVVGRRENPDIQGAEYVRGDLSDPDFADAAWERAKPEIVFHLASRVTGDRDIHQVMPTFRANLLATVNVLKSSTDERVSRVVLAGSMEEPNQADAPPPSPYAAAKMGSTMYARLFNSLYDTPVVTLRTFMVYGPGQQDWMKLIPYVARTALTGGTPQIGSGRRLVDWIFVDDVVEAFVAAAQARSVVGRILDVGTGLQTSIRDVVEMLVRMIDPKIVPAFGARNDRPLEEAPVANVQRTFEHLKWRAETSLEAGLWETVEWVRNVVAEDAKATTRAGASAPPPRARGPLR